MRIGLLVLSLHQPFANRQAHPLLFRFLPPYPTTVTLSHLIMSGNAKLSHLQEVPLPFNVCSPFCHLTGLVKMSRLRWYPLKFTSDRSRICSTEYWRSRSSCDNPFDSTLILIWQWFWHIRRLADHSKNAHDQSIAWRCSRGVPKVIWWQVRKPSVVYMLQNQWFGSWGVGGKDRWVC